MKHKNLEATFSNHNSQSNLKVFVEIRFSNYRTEQLRSLKHYCGYKLTIVDTTDTLKHCFSSQIN